MRIIKTVVSRGAIPPPLELTKALMVREFHMTPEEVEQHPADSLFQTFSILNHYDEQVKKITRRK